MSNYIKNLNISEDYFITVPTLLRDYCGITDKKILERITTHREIKKARLDGVRALPFDCFKREEVLRSEVLMVIDIKNQKVPYDNPLIEKTLNLIKK